MSFRYRGIAQLFTLRALLHLKNLTEVTLLWLFREKKLTNDKKNMVLFNEFKGIVQ